MPDVMQEEVPDRLVAAAQRCSVEVCRLPSALPGLRQPLAQDIDQRVHDHRSRTGLAAPGRDQDHMVVEAGQSLPTQVLDRGSEQGAHLIRRISRLLPQAPLVGARCRRSGPLAVRRSPLASVPHGLSSRCPDSRQSDRQATGLFHRRPAVA